MNHTDSIAFSDYELLDCGDERRLERFASHIIDRPAPGAHWRKSLPSNEWKQADVFFDREVGDQGEWRDSSALQKISLGALTLELRLSANSQVGLFPEQLANWQWIHDTLKPATRPIHVLNAFAYTGAASLIASAASAHVQVCHVDGAKSAVSWARKNAEHSKMAERPIRWINEDVLTFLRKELKRGKVYEGLILDPPAFGRGPGGDWKLERDLPELMSLANELLNDSSSFIVLSCHSPELTSDDLADYINKLKVFADATVETLELVIPSVKGNALPSSICARVCRGPDLQ